MKLTRYLPLIGRGSYEPNFHVEFQGGGKGLDEIVALATSQQRGTFVLGESKLPEPVARIQVYLKPDIHSWLGNAGYILEARIAPVARQKLRVDPSSFNTDFNVRKVIDKVYFLQSHLLPSYSHIDVNTSPVGNKGGIELNNFVAYRNKLTVPEVGDAITAFAKALEIAVNSVYHHARKPAPGLTLALTAGEQIRRIAQKPIEAPAWTKTRSDGASEGNEGEEENVNVPLEALTSSVTFANIGGYQSVKEQLGDFLLAIRSPEEARRHGYTPSKGWLLHGPPGTGKTLFGEALAGEAGAEFVYLNASKVLQMYVGQSTKTLNAAFEGAQKRADETKKPVILFIDEIDSIFPKRGTAHDVKVDLVNLFNQYMDGFETKKIPNVYVVAATNRLHEMDESATRAGRFVKVEVPLPDLEARVAIFHVTEEALENEAGGTKLFDAGIDYNALAKLTDNFSGADIADVMRTARQKAFRQAATAKQKAVVMTTTANIEEQISRYKTQKQGGSGKGPIGFGAARRGG